MAGLTSERGKSVTISRDHRRPTAAWSGAVAPIQESREHHEKGTHRRGRTACARNGLFSRSHEHSELADYNATNSNRAGPLLPSASLQALWLAPWLVSPQIPLRLAPPQVLLEPSRSGYGNCAWLGNTSFSLVTGGPCPYRKPNPKIAVM